MYGIRQEKIKKAYDYIEDDKVECARCKGTGVDPHTYFPDIYKCKRCNGTGKTDWITNVMGLKDEEYEESCYSTSCSSTSCSSNWRP